MDLKFFKKGWFWPQGLRKTFEERFPNISTFSDSISDWTGDSPDEFKNSIDFLSDYDAFDKDQEDAFFRRLAEEASAEGRDTDASFIESVRGKRRKSV